MFSVAMRVDNPNRSPLTIHGERPLFSAVGVEREVLFGHLTSPKCQRGGNFHPQALRPL